MITTEGNCKWNFAPLQSNMLGQGAQNAIIAHFNKSPYTSLIRESIQNSLDAPISPNIPVRVEYSFSRIQASEYPNFFDLQTHILGIKTSFPHNKSAIDMANRMYNTFQVHRNKLRMPFIKVSDYNTTGMQYRKKGTEKSPFTSFLRVAGDSLKNNVGSGGSFGFGKAAYFNISPIRTVLVSTRTINNEVYFEGGSMLTDHYHNGIEKSFYGFYDCNDGKFPIDKEELIPQHFKRDQPGTDFYIMGVQASDTDRQEAETEMIIATLRNFWLAIYHKRLEVKIGDTLITHDNLGDLMELYFPISRDDKNRSEQYNPRPYYEAVAHAGIDNKHILIKGNIDILGEVHLFIKKTKDAKDKVAYLRSPRMLVYSKQFQTSYGCYCVFFCDNPEGNAFLGGMENAAHKEWDPANMSDDASTGREAIKAIREFISESLETLFAADGDAPLGISGLEEFLYIEDDMLPSDDDDLKDNPFFGSITGQFIDEGTSMTSQLNPIQPKIHELPKPKQGKIVAKKKTKAKKNENGELGGNASHTGENGHRQTPAPGNKPKEENNEGKEGTYREFTPVRYRVVASRNLQGKIEHSIILHSPKDIENAMIELVVAGEQDTEIMDITHSTHGEFINNQIYNLKFVKGRNVTTFQFGDNLKHPVILKAYEFK